MFKNVDIIEELLKERTASEKQQDRLIDQAVRIIDKTAEREGRILDRIIAGSSTGNAIMPCGQLDRRLIFSGETIRKICSRYRLRFLNSNRFRGDIPLEALSKVRHLEDRTGQPLHRFKIIAPAARFKLSDATEDPVLFADLGNGNYYMIHKWGNDMSWYRRILSFPLRNISNLAITALSAGVLLALLMPASFLPETSWDSPFKLVLAKTYVAFILSGFCFVTSLILGILSSKEFSEDVWNSEFFN